MIFQSVIMKFKFAASITGPSPWVATVLTASGSTKMDGWRILASDSEGSMVYCDASFHFAVMSSIVRSLKEIDIF